MLHADLVTFAARFNIAPSEAHVLPALFERSAALVGREARALLSEATFTNAPLGAYLAQCAKKVAAECPR